MGRLGQPFRLASQCGGAIFLVPAIVGHFSEGEHWLLLSTILYPPFHSYLSATNGSTLVARRAGR